MQGGLLQPCNIVNLGVELTSASGMTCSKQSLQGYWVVCKSWMSTYLDIYEVNVIQLQTHVLCFGLLYQHV